MMYRCNGNTTKCKQHIACLPCQCCFVYTSKTVADQGCEPAWNPPVFKCRYICTAVCSIEVGGCGGNTSPEKLYLPAHLNKLLGIIVRFFPTFH